MGYSQSHSRQLNSSRLLHSLFYHSLTGVMEVALSHSNICLSRMRVHQSRTLFSVCMKIFRLCSPASHPSLLLKESLLMRQFASMQEQALASARSPTVTSVMRPCKKRCHSLSLLASLYAMIPYLLRVCLICQLQLLGEVAHDAIIQLCSPTR